MSNLFRFAVLAISLSFLSPNDAHTATAVHSWSQRYGDVGDQYASSLAVDPSGNVIVAGYFSGTVNFGGANLTSTGDTDIFVAKFSAAGVHQWSQRFGGAFEDKALSVAVSTSGDVIVAGSFEGTVNFGGGNLVSSGLADIFVVEFSAGGVHKWSRRFGDASDQIAQSVAVDGSDNVVVTGRFRGTVNFGGGNLASAGDFDVFVGEFNGMGVHQWSHSFGDAAYQAAFSVAVDTPGNVVITGEFGGSINFGGAPLTSAGSWDAFVARFNAAGVHQWSQRFGDSALQQGSSVAVDASGNSIVTGYFYGTVNFGGGNLTSVGPTDIFAVKFNSAGVHQWSQNFGGADGQAGVSVAADATENVIIAGVALPAFDFDISLIKLNPAGASRWTKYFGGALDQYVTSVAADAMGNVLVTGYFTGAVDFGGGALNSAGSTDIFIAKFAPGPQPTIVDVTDVGNDQGRQVKIRFERSGLDDAVSATPIRQYEAYLRNDPLPTAPAALLERASVISDMQLVPGWTYVGAVPAHAEGSYEIYAPTMADSTIADGQHYSTFFIRAATSAPAVFYDSAPDSGYSLDNLVPAVPAMFAMSSSGVLAWEESDAPDFDHYSVYGSDSDAFDGATLIDHTSNTSMDVSGWPYAYYFLTAADRSGNESEPAVVGAPTGVGDAPMNYALSVSAYPNPFNPSTTVRYTVPFRGKVTISVHDPRGARIATLVDRKTHEAGVYAERWDGRTDAGAPVASGVYFVRIEQGEAVRTGKVVLLK
jgi:hypothetical protein